MLLWGRKGFIGSKIGVYMAIVIQVLAVIGLLLSVYALYVEQRFTKIGAYKPWCDISPRISCTKVLSSSYGHLIGIPNSALGIGFYLIIFILASIFGAASVFWLAVFGVVVSIYLAYLSLAKLKLFCVVCGGTYLVNILLLIASYFRL